MRSGSPYSPKLSSAPLTAAALVGGSLELALG